MSRSCQTAPSPCEGLRPSTPPQVIKRVLTNHPGTYIESITMDKPELSALVDPNSDALGEAPVMRLVYGAVKDGERMPARAVSYALSALAIAAELPEKTAPQLQIIHANRLGASINGTNIKKARDEAQMLATVVRGITKEHFPALMEPGRFVHVEDTPIDIELYQALARQAAERNPKGFTSVESKANNHAGDAYPYLGGHFAFQDTASLELTPLLEGGPGSLAVIPTSVISIGGLKEKAFHQARQAMRATYPDSELARSGVPMLPVGQIFTRHKVPPYYTARGGEQSLEDAIRHGIDLTETAYDKDVVRDVQHMVSVLGERALQGGLLLQERLHA